MKYINNSKVFYSLVFLFSVITPFPATASAADDTALPQWEISIGAGLVHQPYYTGTKQTRQFGFPIVAPTYRGKVFKSDDKGIRAQLFKSERVALDFSADLNLSIDSDDIDLRQGMDDIENIVQFGPSLELMLDKTENSELMINLPIRGAFEVGNVFEASGLTLSPNLFYKRKFPMLNKEWNFGASIGPQFGTAKYHDVFYGVDSQFATAERNAYETDKGYSGSRLQLSLNSKSKKQFILGFLRYENIDGASFAESPLVETNHSLTVGFIYTYNFLKSKTLVSH